MDKIKRAMPFLITALMVATLLVVQFTVLTARKPDSGFWVNVAVNAAIIVAMSLTWMASGGDRAKNAEDLPYRRNSEEYGRRIALIEKEGKYGSLAAFCKQKSEEMRLEKENRILSSVGLDRVRYEALRDKSRAELLKSEKLEKRQVRAIERVCEGKVRVKEINPLELTTNNRAKNAYDVSYDENADRALSIAVRVVKSLVTGAALACVGFELAGNVGDLTAWAMFLMKLVTIAFTAWSSEREGYEQIATTKNRVILRRISFLTLFNEWAQVPLLGKGKGKEE